MLVRSLLDKIKGDLPWAEFRRRTGVSQPTAWKMVEMSRSSTPERIKALCALAKKRGIVTTHKEILFLLLSEKVAGSLVDLDLIASGAIPLDKWMRNGTSQRSQARTLGLSYSTIYHRRNGSFKHFWPKRAIEIVRRSNYRIDIFDLLGIDRKWLT